MLSQSLIETYRQTDYCFGDIVLTIDQPSIETATLLKPFAPKGGVFITACNPLGDVVTPVKNKLANEVLKEDLLSQGLTVIAGYGESADKNNADKKWREDSFFAYPVDENISLHLCVKYLQNAVVYVDYNGLPTLRFYNL